MDYVKTLLVLALCACGDAEETLSAAMQRRGRRDAARPAYVRQYADDYEPYAYAAIPLHAPMPIVHVLSPTPVNRYIQAQKQRTRQTLDRDLHAYTSQNEEYEPYEYNNYAYGPTGHKYPGSAAVIEEESQPVVIYARPNPSGGYSYRKRPFATPVTPARPKREPIVFRIHKYKITKE